MSRIRKVKCDETRPICHRCRSTGRTCDGYPTIRSLPLSILNSQRELHSYHYFWNKVLPILPGHYDHPFWGIWVRRASFGELAIQHAMVAVGALHESIAASFAGSTTTFTHLTPLSIQQYNKAIRNLTVDAAYRPPVEIVLTTCILFIMFENLAGRSSEAVKHLRNGTEILQSWETTTISEVAAKEEYLTPILTCGYSPGVSTTNTTIGGGIEAARMQLHLLLDKIYAAMDVAMLSSNQATIARGVSKAEESLREWYSYFLTIPDPIDKEQRRSKISLALQFETALVLTSAVSLEDECQYDKHLDSFRKIVDQCERLIALERLLVGLSPTEAHDFMYSFDLYMQPSLAITAFKCRDPKIRREAIMLLRTGHRYEGLWNGRIMARIAQATLEVEESGLPVVSVCTDIPRWRRITLDTLCYSPSRQVSSTT